MLYLAMLFRHAPSHLTLSPTPQPMQGRLQHLLVAALHLLGELQLLS